MFAADLLIVYGDMDAHTSSDIPPVALSPAHFALLSRVIRSVARTHRLSPCDAEDFGQTVHLKLLERSYDVFRSFEGRSSLSTYLHVVVTRLLLDWRNATQGKWRPSASALRLGPRAVALERLMHRDGLTRDEAVTMLACQQSAGGPETERALRALADDLPPRCRRAIVNEAALEGAESRARIEFEDPVAASEARARQRELRLRLQRACAELPAEDRRLIDLRFGRALTVQAIGLRLGTNPKPLYRRLERSLARLRRSLNKGGPGHATHSHSTHVSREHGR